LGRLTESVLLAIGELGQRSFLEQPVAGSNRHRLGIVGASKTPRKAPTKILLLRERMQEG